LTKFLEKIELKEEIGGNDSLILFSFGVTGNSKEGKRFFLLFILTFFLMEEREYIILKAEYILF